MCQNRSAMRDILSRLPGLRIWRTSPALRAGAGAGAGAGARSYHLSFLRDCGIARRARTMTSRDHSSVTTRVGHAFARRTFGLFALLSVQSPGRGERIVAFAPAGAEDLENEPSTPGGRWRRRPGLPSFVPAGLRNRWPGAGHDIERSFEGPDYGRPSSAYGTARIARGPNRACSTITIWLLRSRRRCSECVYLSPSHCVLGGETSGDLYP